LGRLEYLGHVVNFRTYKESYKDNTIKNRDKEEWKIFENKHPAIIDQATFDTVQKLRGTPRRTDSIGEANPLTGLMFCADCGAKMYNQRHAKETHLANHFGKLYPHKMTDSYNCSNYKLGKDKFKEACSGHHIQTAVVRELVLNTIQSICHYVRDNEAEFIQKIREESNSQQAENEKLYRKQLVKNERRISELDNLFRKVYEDNASGKLSDKRYEQMSADYEKEQTELEAKNKEMQTALDSFSAENEKVDGFLGLVKKYTEFEELTTPMLNEFVSKIIVHKAVKTEWERTQRVDIVFNFIGEFRLPIVEIEPTPEEIEAEEKRRIKLRQQREANRKHREKKRAIYEAQKQKAKQNTTA
jgi:hypothetical protein